MVKNITFNDGSFASTKVSAEQVRQLFSPTGS